MLPWHIWIACLRWCCVAWYRFPWQCRLMTNITGPLTLKKQSCLIKLSVSPAVRESLEKWGVILSSIFTCEPHDISGGGQVLLSSPSQGAFKGPRRGCVSVIRCAWYSYSRACLTSTFAFFFFLSDKNADCRWKVLQKTLDLMPRFQPALTYCWGKSIICMLYVTL